MTLATKQPEGWCLDALHRSLAKRLTLDPTELGFLTHRFKHLGKYVLNSNIFLYDLYIMFCVFCFGSFWVE